MAKEKKPRKRQMTAAEKIATMSPAEFSKLTGGDEGLKQLTKYYNTLRQGFNRRMAQIRNAGKYSWAGEQIEKTLYNKPASAIKAKYKGQKKATRKVRNMMLSEIAKYQTFFQSQTSSLGGIYEVEQAQDKRIFENSDTMTSMSEDERKYFWSVYNEYVNSTPVAHRRFYSKTTQQTLAAAIFERNTPELLEKAARYGIEHDLDKVMRDSFSYHLAKLDLMLKIQSAEKTSLDTAGDEDDELDVFARDWD